MLQTFFIWSNYLYNVLFVFPVGKSVLETETIIQHVMMNTWLFLISSTPSFTLITMEIQSTMMLQFWKQNLSISQEPSSLSACQGMMISLSSYIIMKIVWPNKKRLQHLSIEDLLNSSEELHKAFYRWIRLNNMLNQY